MVNLTNCRSTGQSKRRVITVIQKMGKRKRRFVAKAEREKGWRIWTTSRKSGGASVM
jgi:hypothetical protein